MNNICLASNWDQKLVEEAAKLNSEFEGSGGRIYELFATLRTSVVGGGRPSAMIPDVAKEQAGDYIELVHASGMRFNYLLNSACMGNREYHPKHHAELISYLDEIVNLGADSVTIAIPYLMEVVRDQYPDLEIISSSFCRIDSVRKAVFFEELGAKRIVLPHTIRRKFGLIKRIRDAVDCDIELLVNNTCIHQCALANYHAGNSSHASQLETVKYGGHYIQYSMFHCNIQRLRDPAELLKSTWVRPEDVVRYEKLGIDFVKIEGRNRTTDWILNAARAYLERQYDGNAFDLLSQTVLGYLQQNPLIDEPLPALDINIDNRALEGFLDFFESGNCKDDCTRCSYCGDFAKKAVRFDKNLAARYIDSANALIKHLKTSSFIKDFEETGLEWEEKAPKDATMKAK
ncbi:U32 family peptidase [archaeon]|nr:U32 family peptidase [archaeon]